MNSLKIKYLVIWIILIISSSNKLFGQQLPLYSEYMFNSFEINPAYAGFRDAVNITTMYRKQWTGSQSAPQSTFMAIDMPVAAKRVGLGVKIVDDRDEVTKTFGAQAAYSFKIPTGDRSSVALGLQAGLLNFKSDLTKIDVIDPNDPSFSENINTTKLNFGTGVFFHTEFFFAGFSSPNLFRNNLKRNQPGAGASDVKQNTHVYFNTGYVFSLSDDIFLKPSILVRGVVGAPLSYDLNANFLIADRLTLGASYRNNTAVVGILDVRILSELHLGYAYDHSISRLNIIAKGSQEIMLRYEIPVGKISLSPRFF